MKNLKEALKLTAHHHHHKQQMFSAVYYVRLTDIRHTDAQFQSQCNPRALLMSHHYLPESTCHHGHGKYNVNFTHNATFLSFPYTSWYWICLSKGQWTEGHWRASLSQRWKWESQNSCDKKYLLMITAFLLSTGAMFLQRWPPLKINTNILRNIPSLYRHYRHSLVLLTQSALPMFTFHRLEL